MMSVSIRGVLMGVIVMAQAALVSAEPAKEHAGKGEHAKRHGDKAKALSFSVKDIDGKTQDLKQYKGKVVMIVNVASQCGLTKQYEGLEALYEKYKDKGFVILGFPANEFGKQEPGSDSEIKDFCTSKFHVTFPMFSKVVVKGDDICPLYKYLTSDKSGHKFGGEIKWNFNKFLIDRNGRVIDRFEPPVKPDDAKLIKAVEKALDEEASAGPKPHKDKP
jgi:glutathione peroxidase